LKLTKEEAEVSYWEVQ